MSQSKEMSEVSSIKDAGLREVGEAASTALLKELHAKYLGKSGLLSLQMRKLGEIRDPDAKREFGRTLNESKAELETALAERMEGVKQGERLAQFQAEAIDVTMPGRPAKLGFEHIIAQTSNKIKRVMGGLGFEYLEGPELEELRYNFSALNYPPDHPAMDDQDTFYVTDEKLLRTQCTALQGRVFESRKPPLRVVTIGKTFRNEAIDRTHNHTFHQVDCFMIDEGVSMAHLKGTLGLFARAMFGSEVKVRFRPDFFPFVEPGVDYAISTPRLFNGKWVELGGAGLIHPNILEAYGIDSERYSGFAFGLGVERIPMMAYGVDDLRHFMENDLRFLSKFQAEYAVN
jgi:phenylalanyl-tRNA synthetase alpha chain